MSDTLKVITDGWTQLTHSPLWLVLAVVIFCGCLLLRSWKFFPNKFIPLATFPICTLAYAFMGNPGDINPDIPYPRVMLAFYGFVLNFVVWIAQKPVVRWLEKRFPVLQPALEEFDSVPPIPLPDGSNTKPPTTNPNES